MVSIKKKRLEQVLINKKKWLDIMLVNKEKKVKPSAD